MISWNIWAILFSVGESKPILQKLRLWSSGQNWEMPRHYGSFLGLIEYYRRFVIAPLTELLKKDNFKCGENAREAFQKLKEAMTTVPVLAMPNFSKAFELEMDASGSGVGAILMQEGKPIAYYSQALTRTAKLTSVYERELMAIVFAGKRWHHYLLGHHFIIKTDQKALKFLLEQRQIRADLKKWISKLMGYDFEIHYKPGKENRVADALSRRDNVRV